MALATDPAAAVAALHAQAPPVDKRLLANPQWEASLTHGAQDAVAQGIEGWVSEARLVRSAWPVQPDAVRQRVLLVHGEDDLAVSIDAVRSLAERLPDAQLRVVPGAGHFGALADAAPLSDELRSL